MQSAHTDLPPGSDSIPGDGIPWVCAHCWFILGPSTIPRSAALRKLHEHFASAHRKQEESSIGENQDDLEDHEGQESLEDEGDEEDHENQEDLDNELQDEEPESDDADIALHPTEQLNTEKLNAPCHGRRASSVPALPQPSSRRPA
jgi:hypothetical protein